MPPWKYRRLQTQKRVSDKRNDVSELDGFVENSPFTLSLYSRLFFIWLSDIVKLASVRPLDENDLFSIVDQVSSDVLTEKINRIWSIELKKCKKGKMHEPCLWWVVLKFVTFAEVFKMISLCGVEVVSTIMQPVFLSLLLSYMMAWGETQPNSGHQWQPFAYVGGLFACLLLQSAVRNQWLYFAVVMACNIRTALSGLVFNKVSI